MSNGNRNVSGAPLRNCMFIPLPVSKLLETEVTLYIGNFVVGSKCGPVSGERYKLIEAAIE